jgi:hypothetical protein
MQLMMGRMLRSPQYGYTHQQQYNKRLYGYLAMLF